MTKNQIVVWGSWIIATLVTFLAVLVWGQSFLWQFDAMSSYLLFPLFGLLAFGLMWTHYVAGSLRRAMSVKKSELQQFLNITGYAVLGLILLHPGLLIWQLLRDGKGFPPESYLHYVAPNMAWITALGTVSLGVFLAYELRPWFQDRSWWPWVTRAGNLAMVAIVYHGLRLGSQTQTGWYHYVWLFYGTTLLASLGYNYYIDRQTKEEKV